MEKVTIGTYRKVAVTLWAVVSVVAGLTIGAMFDLSGRRTVFAVAVTVGAYVLMVVRMYRNVDVQLEKSLDEHVNGFNRQKAKSGAAYSQPVSSKTTDVNVEKMQSNDKEMSDKETQEWLDKFLVFQQKGEEIKSDEDRIF